MKVFLLSICFIFSVLLKAQVDCSFYIYESTTLTAQSGVVVEFRNSNLGIDFSQTTDANGIAYFAGVPVANGYSLRVGVQPQKNQTEVNITDIDLRSNTNPHLKIGILAAQYIDLPYITVRPSALDANLRNAEVAAQLSQKALFLLPTEGRDVSRALYRLPHVVPATGFYPEAPTVSINGSNSLYTSYLIDGMDNNERFLGGSKFNIPLGFVQNINVLTNNFSTAYGHTANGIVNITTPSGGNKMVGEVYFGIRPGAVIDAPSRYILRDLSGNQVKDGFQRYQTGLSLSGPLRKDKTFYALNAELTRDIKDNFLVAPALGINTTVRGNNNFGYFSGKILHRWSDNLTSSLRGHLGRINIARQGGGLEGGNAFPSAANYQDRNSMLLASQNTWLGNKFKLESNLQYATFRWNYGRAANPNAPNVSVLGPDELSIAALGHPGYLFDAHEKTWQTQQKMTYYLPKHTLKAGIDVIVAQHELFGGGNPNGSYVVKLTEQQLADIAAKNVGAGFGIADIPTDVQVLNYNVELRPQAFGTTQSIYSGYFEDEIKYFDKLIVTLGLRYDYDDLSKGGAKKGDGNNIAPRVSANYQLNKNDNIRFGYGVFYDKINYAIYSDALQQNTKSSDFKRQLQQLKDLGILPQSTDIEQITFNGNQVASLNNVTYLQGPTGATLQDQRAGAYSNERRILNPEGYKNPYSNQMMLGYQKTINSEILFFGDIVYNESFNLFRLRDLNAPTFYDISANNNQVQTAAAADATRPIPVTNNQIVIAGDTIFGGSRSITVTESAGRARFLGLSLNLQKQRRDANDKFEYRLNYTLSRLENNTEDINFRAEQANDFSREWAVGINDRTHVIQTVFTYYPIAKLSFTLATLLQSGQPINRIPDASVYGTTDLNGDGRAFADAYTGNSDRHPGEKRNSDRLPWANTFDLSTQFELPLAKTKLVFRADVFNLLNAENLSGYFNNATQSNQVQVGAASSGLLVRRNAAPPRQFQFSVSYKL